MPDLLLDTYSEHPDSDGSDGEDGSGSVSPEPRAMPVLPRNHKEVYFRDHEKPAEDQPQPSKAALAAYYATQKVLFDAEMKQWRSDYPALAAKHDESLKKRREAENRAALEKKRAAEASAAKPEPKPAAKKAKEDPAVKGGTEAEGAAFARGFVKELAALFAKV